DLVELCGALLARVPAARPTGAELLARLDVHAAPPPARAAELFIGRDGERAALHAAFDAARAGAPVLALVHGSSGLGKSTLLTRFARELTERHPGALVIGGRCQEPESVPYKALDAVIDALARRLQRLRELDAEGLMPRHAAALARLFPVMRRVPAL